jgi:hypothetical protein
MSTILDSAHTEATAHPTDEDSHEPKTELPVNAFLSKLMEDIKSPIVSATFLALLATVGWLAYDHVSRADFQMVQKQLQGLQYTFDHNHIDGRLNTVKDKLFDVKQKMAAEKDKGSVVESLYEEQLNDLDRQKENLEHDMNVLEHQRIGFQP